MIGLLFAITLVVLLVLWTWVPIFRHRDLVEYGVFAAIFIWCALFLFWCATA